MKFELRQSWRTQSMSLSLWAEPPTRYRARAPDNRDQEDKGTEAESFLALERPKDGQMPLIIFKLPNMLFNEIPIISEIL